MSLEAWGDENPDDIDAERLLDAGWLTDEQAKRLMDAGNLWVRAHRDRLLRHDLQGELQMQLRAAERDLEDALIEVFGEQITNAPTSEGNAAR